MGSSKHMVLTCCFLSFASNTYILPCGLWCNNRKLLVKFVALLPFHEVQILGNSESSLLTYCSSIEAKSMAPHTVGMSHTRARQSYPCGVVKGTEPYEFSNSGTAHPSHRAPVTPERAVRAATSRIISNPLLIATSRISLFDTQQNPSNGAKS